MNTASVTALLDADASASEILGLLTQLASPSSDASNDGNFSNELNPHLASYISASPSCKELLQLFDKCTTSNSAAEFKKERESILSAVLTLFSRIIVSSSVDTLSTKTISSRQNLVYLLLHASPASVYPILSIERNKQTTSDSEVNRLKALEKCVESTSFSVLYSLLECLTSLVRFSIPSARCVSHEFNFSSTKLYRLCDLRLTASQTSPYQKPVQLSEFINTCQNEELECGEVQWPKEWGRQRVTMRTLGNKYFRGTDYSSWFSNEHDAVGSSVSILPVKYAIRQQYALLIDAFLSSNDKFIISRVLKGSNFISQYFYRLENDRPVDALGFLFALKSRFVQPLFIPNYFKISLFNRFTLRCLSSLLSKHSLWESCDVLVYGSYKMYSNLLHSNDNLIAGNFNANDFYSRGSSSFIVVEFILAVLLKPQLYSTPAGHSTLLDFCLQLKPVLPPQQYVILRILKAYPNIYPKYFKDFSLLFVPKESVEFCVHSKFLVDLMCLQYPRHLLNVFDGSIDITDPEGSDKHFLRRVFPLLSVEEAVEMLLTFSGLLNPLKPSEVSTSLVSAEREVADMNYQIFDDVVDEATYIAEALPRQNRLFSSIAAKQFFSSKKRRVLNRSSFSLSNCATNEKLKGMSQLFLKSIEAIGKFDESELYNRLKLSYCPPSCINRSVLTKGVLHFSKLVVNVTLSLIEAIVWRAYMIQYGLSFLCNYSVNQLQRSGIDYVVSWRCKQALQNLQYDLRSTLPDLQTFLSLRSRIWDYYTGEDASAYPPCGEFIFTETVLLKHRRMKETTDKIGEKLILNIGSGIASPGISSQSESIDDTHLKSQNASVSLQLMCSFFFSYSNFEVSLAGSDMLARWSNTLYGICHIIPSVLLGSNYDWSKLLAHEVLQHMQNDPNGLLSIIKLVTTALGGFDKMTLSQTLRRSSVFWLERVLECWITHFKPQLENMSEEGPVHLDFLLGVHCDKSLKKYFASFGIFETFHFDEVALWLSNIQSLQSLWQKHLCASFFLYCLKHSFDFASPFSKVFSSQGSNVFHLNQTSAYSFEDSFNGLSPFMMCALTLLTGNCNSIGSATAKIGASAAQKEINTRIVHRFVYSTLQWCCLCLPKLEEVFKSFVSSKGVWMPFRTTWKGTVNSEDSVSAVHLCEWSTKAFDPKLCAKLRSLWLKCLDYKPSPLQTRGDLGSVCSQNAVTVERICKELSFLTPLHNLVLRQTALSKGSILNGVACIKALLRYLNALIMDNVSTLKDAGQFLLTSVISSVKGIKECLRGNSNGLLVLLLKTNMRVLVEECLGIILSSVHTLFSTMAYLKRRDLIFLKCADALAQLVSLFYGKEAVNSTLKDGLNSLGGLVKKIWEALLKFGMRVELRMPSPFQALKDAEVDGEDSKSNNLVPGSAVWSGVKYLVRVDQSLNLYVLFQYDGDEASSVGNNVDDAAAIEMKVMALRYAITNSFRSHRVILPADSVSYRYRRIMKCLIHLFRKCRYSSVFDNQNALFLHLWSLVASLLKQFRCGISKLSHSEDIKQLFGLLLFGNSAVGFTHDNLFSEKFAMNTHFQPQLEVVMATFRLSFESKGEFCYYCLQHLVSCYAQYSLESPRFCILLFLILLTIPESTKVFEASLDLLSNFQFFTEQAGKFATESTTNLFGVVAQNEIRCINLWILLFQNLIEFSAEAQFSNFYLLYLLDMFTTFLQPHFLTVIKSKKFGKILVKQLLEFVSSQATVHRNKSQLQDSNTLTFTCKRLKVLLEETRLLLYQNDLEYSSHLFIGMPIEAQWNTATKVDLVQIVCSDLLDIPIVTHSPIKPYLKILNERLEAYSHAFQNVFTSIKQMFKEICSYEVCSTTAERICIFMRHTATLAFSVKRASSGISAPQLQFLIEASSLSKVLKMNRLFLEFLEKYSADRATSLTRQETRLFLQYWKAILSLHRIYLRGCYSHCSVEEFPVTFVPSSFCSSCSTSFTVALESAYLMVASILKSKLFLEILEARTYEHWILEFLASDLIPLYRICLRHSHYESIITLCPALYLHAQRHYRASLTLQDLKRRTILQSNMFFDRDTLRNIQLPDFMEPNVERKESRLNLDHKRIHDVSSKASEFKALRKGDHFNDLPTFYGRMDKSNILQFQWRRIQHTLENFSYSAKLIRSDTAAVCYPLFTPTGMCNLQNTQDSFDSSEALVYDIVYIIPYITERLRLMYLLSIEKVKHKTNLLAVFEAFERNEIKTSSNSEAEGTYYAQVEQLYQSYQSYNFDVLKENVLKKYATGTQSSCTSLYEAIAYAQPAFCESIDESGMYLKYFAQGGGLHLLLLSLSCTDEPLRALGYEGMALYTQMLQNSLDETEILHEALPIKYRKGQELKKHTIKYAFKELPHLLSLFIAFKNTLSRSSLPISNDCIEENSNASNGLDPSKLMLVPSFLTVFVSAAVTVILHAENALYPFLNKFLHSRPQFDLMDIPMFYEFFNSTRMESASYERSWLLKVLRRSASHFGSFGSIALSASDKFLYLNKLLHFPDCNAMSLFWSALKRRHIIPSLFTLCNDFKNLELPDRMNTIQIFLKLTSIESNFVLEENEPFSPPISIFITIELIRNFGYLKWLKSQIQFVLEFLIFPESNELYVPLDLSSSMDILLRRLEWHPHSINVDETVNATFAALAGLTQCLYHVACHVTYPPLIDPHCHIPYHGLEDLYTLTPMRLFNCLRNAIDIFETCSKRKDINLDDTETLKISTLLKASFGSNVERKFMDSPFSWAALFTLPTGPKQATELMRFSRSLRNTVFGGVPSDWSTYLSSQVSLTEVSEVPPVFDDGEVWLHQEFGLVSSGLCSYDKKETVDEFELDARLNHRGGNFSVELNALLNSSSCFKARDTTTLLSSLIDCLKSICRGWFIMYSTIIGTKVLKKIEGLLGVYATGFDRSIGDIEIMEAIGLITTQENGSWTACRDGPFHLVRLADKQSEKHLLLDRCINGIKTVFLCLWSICWGIGNTCKSFTELFDPLIHLNEIPKFPTDFDSCDIDWRAFRSLISECIDEILQFVEFLCVTKEVLGTIRRYFCSSDQQEDPFMGMTEKQFEVISSDFKVLRIPETFDKCKVTEYKKKELYEIVLETLRSHPKDPDREGTGEYRYLKWATCIKFLHIWMLCGNRTLPLSSNRPVCLQNYVEFISDGFLYERDSLDALFNTIHLLI